MMRKLLLFFAMLCVSIGTRAQGTVVGDNDAYISTDTWFSNVAAKTENVVKIKIETPGSLATALAQVDQSQYGVMYINLVDGSYLNDADITALSDITVGTIDLQDAKYTADGAAFTFSNSSVKNLILPDGWTKADVKACAQAVGSNLGSAYSQNVISDDATELVAYVNKPGTLRDAMDHCFLDNKDNNKIGTGINRYSQSFGKIKYASLMGNVAARDFNGSETCKYDPDGHFVFNVAADETSMARNAGVGGVDRELVGTTMKGALYGAGLISLDLEDAIITDAHCDDLNLAWSNVINDNTKEIKIPTTSELTILPADFLNVTAKSFEEICIPGNIQVIRTRAIYLADSNIRHIWTTGTKTLAEGEVDHTIYDNGAYLLEGKVMHTGHAPLDDENWNKQGSTAVRYGTITLPPNLTLIESHAFKSDYISDVYSLNKTAPECHVDAFSSVMYMGNNTINGDVNGMITRESYAVSTDEAKYIAFLHYPRECTTPDIQRYTDVTREYSVATTLRDGRGNVIYFPNQSELNRAFYQGTTGYLWYAWNSHRTPEFYNNANSFDEADISGDFTHTDAVQQFANRLYRENTYTDPDKTDRSFYDVRLGSTEQPTEEKPSDLKWYYETIWEKKQLYPQMETTQTQTVIGRVQSEDAEGHLLYESGDCNYVQDYEYVKQDDGELVWVRTVTEDANGSKVKDYYYSEASDGVYYKPMMQETGERDQTNFSKYWFYKSTGEYVESADGDYILTSWGAYVTVTEATSWWGAETVATYTKYKYETTGEWVHITSVNNDFWNNTLYYVSDSYTTWSEGVTDIIAGVNDTRYKKIYTEEYRDYNASTDAGETRYNVEDQGLQPYTDAYADSGYDRYHKQYKDYTYREFDSSKDATDEPRYCPVMEDVYAVEKGKQYDYRGWHQFILTAYATNDDRPITPVKFYQSDPDWWTVCLPYDLTYSEMVRFFGNGEGNIPYLSKLRYVVRDYDEQKITLMFSKNLMVYKEEITNPTIMDDYVHGVIDDVTTYTEEELAADPIILHKGVPYLIKPNIPEGANRSFDVYKNELAENDLYDRLNNVQYLDAGALETMIYKGEYTVPAYVIGDNAPEATQATREFTYAAGPTFTYNSADQITYGGKKVSAKISSDFSYTFVGSFFLSMMPQNCYFLGWDSKKKCAAFWYNRVPNPSSYDWNNQTGIICPNFNTSLQIDPATSLSDPARWIVSASDIENDDLVGSAGAKQNTLGFMDWGGSVDVVVSGIGQINVDNAQNKAVQEDVIYDLRGVRMNKPLSRLTKGVYIVNGKKYVVE